MHSRRWIPPLLSLLLAEALSAQAPGTPASATQYWLTTAAGIGHSYFADGFPTSSTGLALAAAATAQHRNLVASLRWTRARTSLATTWDLGLLAGLGSSPQFPVRGSLAAGIGLGARSGHRAQLAVPMEFQLGWRMTRSVGLSTYAFGTYRGSTLTLGATVGLQLGRLH